MYFTALYDWSRTKHALVTDWCTQKAWMAVCDVCDARGTVSSSRKYCDTKEEAIAFARAWIAAKHDRTPQPKFNAWGAQCGWWKSDELLTQARVQVLEQVQTLERAIHKAQG